jgi:tRNA pseudouridine55 synthase
MTGLLLVDKPAGLTSHDVVDRLRQKLGEKKAGHAGTLDPQATGLLVLAFGDATRWLPYLPGDKRYLAKAAFGLETDTEDIWGKELRRADASGLSQAQIRGALEALKGRTSQVPPMVSALKHQGRRLYELAREGVEVERKARPMEIFEIKVLRVSLGAQPEAEFEVHCGGGTYVRSLCAEAGTVLGSGGCMSALRRTAVGPFRIEGALPWEEALPTSLLGADKALAHLKEFQVPPAAEKSLGNGGDLELAPGEYDEAETWRLNSQDGRLLALASPKRGGSGWRMHPSRVFCRA